MTHEDDDIEAEEWVSAAAVNCAEPATKFMEPNVTDDDFVPLDRNPPFATQFRLNLWTAVCDNLHLFPPYQ